MGNACYWQNRIAAVILAAALFLVSAPAGQAQEDPLHLTMTGHLVAFYTDDGGEEVAELMPLPEVVEQGDIVQYDIEGSNRSDQALSGVKAGGKIPQGTLYVDGSARCDVACEVSFSIDQGKTFSVSPVMEMVTLKDGKKEKQVVSPDRYTDIRFTIEKLGPEGAFKASYAVTVQ